MVDPISPLSPKPMGKEFSSLAQDLSRAVQEVSSVLTNVKASNPDGLLSIATACKNLEPIAKEAENTPNPRLKDIGESVLTILSRAVVAAADGKEASLLSASSSYNPRDPAASDLKKVVEIYEQNPDATRTMLNELSLLLDELKG